MCQSSVQSPEEREAVHVEETREVEPSAAQSQSNSQSSEVVAPAEEPVLRRSSRTTQKPPRLIEEILGFLCSFSDMLNLKGGGDVVSESYLCRCRCEATLTG